MHRLRLPATLAIILVVFVAVFVLRQRPTPSASSGRERTIATASPATRHDTSEALSASAENTALDVDDDREHEPRRPQALSEPNEESEEERERERDQAAIPAMTIPAGSADVEQTTFGTKPPAKLVASFDGLGVGFVGPQGTATTRNPSDNTLAVGPDHIVQIVNTRMAIFTKKGKLFDTTGKALYGPVETRNIFKGFGGGCEARNNGDAVVRYDQLADRWLILMPIFTRLPRRPDDVPAGKSGEPATESVRGQSGQPGAATRLYEPPPPPPDSGQPAGQRPQRPPPDSGSYAMCYALSVGS